MNSTIVDSGSMVSTSTRLHRNVNMTGHLRPRDFYLWLFGQMHVKRMLVSLQLILFVLGIWGLWQTSGVEYHGIDIPGLDAFRSMHATDVNKHIRDSIYVSTTPAVVRPYLYLSRNVISSMSYFYILSVSLALVGLRLVERICVSGHASRCCSVNPAVFLIPFLVSMLSLSAPLLFWSVRNSRHLVYFIKFSQEDSLYTRILEAVRFTFIPMIIIWIAFLYLFYGCVLGFVYVWRRANGWRSRKDAAAASFSWSFKDRQALLNGLNVEAGNASKTGLLSRLSTGNRSWRSTKSTENPTLRGFVSKVDDLNNSRASLLSNVATPDVNTSIDSEAGVADSINASPVTVNRNFTSYSSPARRPLDTVHEEGESQEGTISSSASRM